MRSSILSTQQIARMRGVGTFGVVTRAAPTVDFDLDLDRADDAQLTAQRAALLARLGSPEADDDIAQLTERAQAVASAIEQRNTRVAQANSARQALLDGNITRTANGEPEQEQEQRVEHQSLARAFTASPEFRAYGGSGRSGTVVVPGEVRALFSTTNYPSQPTRVPGIIEPQPQQPLTILDIIDRQSMTSNVVEWVQEDTETLGAAEVAEGSVKPESSWTLALKTDVAATIAHWVNLTRQALDDEAQVQGYINGKLTRGLLKRLNGQILTGDGVSPNLRGILSTSGIGTYVSPAGEDPLIVARKARTVAELSEFTPDTVVAHPLDWESIELSTDDTGRFRALVSVADGATPRVWGLNVVVSTNMTQGTLLVGGFQEGATLWERQGVQLYMTDSHASNFTSNIITLLAEMRAVLSVWRPKAFVQATVTPAV